MTDEVLDLINLLMLSFLKLYVQCNDIKLLNAIGEKANGLYINLLKKYK